MKDETGESGWALRARASASNVTRRPAPERRTNVTSSDWTRPIDRSRIDGIHPSRLASMRATAIANQPIMLAIILLALAEWAAFTWFETVDKIVQFYTPLPVWDYWRIPEHLDAYRHFDFHLLWEQHNEHRIVFPKIIFSLDMLLLHGRMLLPLSATFLCYLGTWFIAAFSLFSDKRVPRTIAIIAALTAAIIIGWQGSALVLAQPFLLQWTLTQFAVTAALLFLSRCKIAANVAYLVLAVFWGVVANYSSANGLFVWPILIAGAFAIGLHKSYVYAVVCAACISIGSFFIGYRFTGSLHLGNFFIHPLYLLEFIAVYLSTPFGAGQLPRIAISIGLLQLASAALMLVVAARWRVISSETGVVLFGSYLFVLITAVVTAAARMNPADPSFAGAGAERYLAVPLVNWGVWALLCLWICARAEITAPLPAVTAIVICIAAWIGFYNLTAWFKGNARYFAKVQLTTIAIESGIDDPRLIRLIYPAPDLVEAALPQLRRERLSIYFKGYSDWLGRQANNLAQIISDPQAGQIIDVFPVPSGVEVSGWADRAEGQKPNQWLAFVNEAGQLAGFGRRFTVSPQTGLYTRSALAWVGFVNLRVPTHSFSAYLIDKRGLIPIPGSETIPLIKAAQPAEAGPAISGIEWTTDPSWTLNGTPEGTFGTPPSTAVYASWTGRDQNTGRIVSSSFRTPANGCIILPVLHGPVVAGLSLQIFDADTNKVIALAPLQDGDTAWEFWRIPIKPAVTHLRVIGDDEGRGWGQWLAVAGPSECR